MRLRFVCIAIVGLILAACQSAPGVKHDPHTGTSLYHSSRVQAANHLLSSLWVQAFYSADGGYALQTNYFTTGGGWAFLEEAYSLGKSYPYLVTDRRVGSCSGGCTIYEDGLIGIEEAEFRQFARTGFEFKLVGRRGSIVGTVPASIFAELLTQVGR